jgi:uncharacterized surface protein with fasciclin (FAS1) repeats
MSRHLLFTLAAIMLTGAPAAIAEEEAKRVNAAITSEAPAEVTENIILSIQSNPKFSTLATALTVSGLTESLSQEGPFTIFAPTNEAFEALPKDELDKLMKPENRDDLISLLSYHVLSGAETTLNIPEGISEPTTVQGTPVIITKSNEGVTIDGARVMDADIPATNGVIHAIDKVITP